MSTRPPDATRLIVRAVLTAIFVVATVLGFLLDRPAVGVVMLCFAVVSVGLLVALIRARHASSP